MILEFKKIHNDFKKYLDDVYMLYKKYNEDITSLDEFVKSRLNDTKPRIMLFGIYNAGKSTLLNALIGEEKAQVGDCPTTSAIHEYDYNGHIVVDTPGIDAPIEHEKISKDHIKKCDVIIFVISANGTFDTEKNYKELIEIINMKKRILIVLNDKIGCEDLTDLNLKENQEILKVKEKLIKNILTISGNDQSILEKFSMVVVNAKRALEGKLKGKEKMIKLSNIERLEKEILCILNEVGAYDVLKTLINNLIECIENFKSKLNLKLNDDDKKITEQINQLHFTKTRYLSSLKSEVKQIVSNYEQQIFYKLKNKQDLTSIFNQIQEDVKNKIEEIRNGFIKEYEQELNNLDLNINLDQYNDLANNVHNKSTSEIEENNLDNKLQLDQNNNKYDNYNKILIAGATLSSTAQIATKKLAETGLKFATKQMTKNAIKWGSKMLMAGANFINVVFAVWLLCDLAKEIFGNSNYNKMKAEVDEYNAKVMAQVQNQLLINQELTSYARMIVLDIYNQLSRSIDKIVNEVFDNVVSEYNKILNQAQIHNQDILDTIKKLIEIINNLKELNIKIAFYKK